jgi:hypothetical protein
MSKARKTTPQNDTTDQPPTISVTKALVFISHDTRDAALAEAFSALLSNVTCGMLKSFRSSDKSGSQGLEYGAEWYPEIMKNLEQASDVVCLLTEQSVGRPWILYEAGVAKGKLGTPVHGLALGVPLAKAATGPFAQFQNCDGDAESVSKLVTQLVKRLPDAEPQKSIVDQQVADFRKKVDDLVKKNHTKVIDDTPKKADESTAVKLFEEVKVMFQELPQRLGSQVINHYAAERSPKRRRESMKQADYLMHILGREVDPATAWLIAISPFREEVPWAYELGLKVYRAMETGHPAEARKAMTEYRHIMHRLMHSPLGEDFVDPRSARMFFDETFEILAHRLTDKATDRRGTSKDIEKS